MRYTVTEKDLDFDGEMTEIWASICECMLYYGDNSFGRIFSAMVVEEGRGEAVEIMREGIGAVYGWLEKNHPDVARRYLKP